MSFSLLILAAIEVEMRIASTIAKYFPSAVLNETSFWIHSKKVIRAQLSVSTASEVNRLFFKFVPTLELEKILRLHLYLINRIHKPFCRRYVQLSI